jgi:hypothetical protein
MSFTNPFEEIMAREEIVAAGEEMIVNNLDEEMTVDNPDEEMTVDNPDEEMTVDNPNEEDNPDEDIICDNLLEQFIDSAYIEDTGANPVGHSSIPSHWKLGAASFQNPSPFYDVAPPPTGNSTVNPKGKLYFCSICLLCHTFLVLTLTHHSP